MGSRSSPQGWPRAGTRRREMARRSWDLTRAKTDEFSTERPSEAVNEGARERTPTTAAWMSKRTPLIWAGFDRRRRTGRCGRPRRGDYSGGLWPLAGSASTVWQGVACALVIDPWGSRKRRCSKPDRRRRPEGGEGQLWVPWSRDFRWRKKAAPADIATEVGRRGVPLWRAPVVGTTSPHSASPMPTPAL